MKQLLMNISRSNIMFKNISSYINSLNSLIAGFQFQLLQDKKAEKTGRRFHCKYGKHSPDYMALHPGRH